MWKLCREKRLFSKYKPSWEIIDSGNVVILENENGYQIKMPASVKFKSRDDRYETTLYLNKAKVILWHKKDDREGDKYELKGALPAKTIPPSGERTVNFTFVAELKAQPLIVVDSYVKYVVYPGEAYINGVSNAHSLGESDKRTAQVSPVIRDGDG